MKLKHYNNSKKIHETSEIKMKLSQIAFYGLKTWKYVPFGREALDEDRRDVKAWKAGSDC
jgi:hypothetical protein